jgi:tetratricopeptide (TPR) repeat protein
LEIASRPIEDIRGLRLQAERALVENTDEPVHMLRAAEARLYDGDVAGALSMLRQVEQLSARSPVRLSAIAERYIQCGQHEHAVSCYQLAVDLRPDDPDLLYNLAASRVALGEMDQANELFHRVIRLNPKDYGAWLNRSLLEKQTPEQNHVEQLKYVKAHLQSTDSGHVAVCFALAKELEDLERYDESFAFLQEGASRRRNLLQYDVAEDEATLAQIAESFPASLLQQVPGEPLGAQAVFVMGLPRSGTTLVDRIISSHSQAESLGEINSLAFSVMRSAGAAQGKTDLIRKSATMDFTELGRNYCQALSGFGKSADLLIDKTPLNFLYLGLIHLALPKAKVIHLKRHPVDSCFAMYKTLFRAGYPFSYSLQDVGRYYIAYNRLMDHWRRVLPGRFLEVDYEQLVTHQEEETRRILDYLGLPWETACLDFHQNPSPSATASAAQVRQPMYSSSVGRWQCYQRQLAPFVQKLREHGIVVD